MGKGRERKGSEKGGGGRGGDGKEGREGKGGDISPAWSSQNLGSTVKIGKVVDQLQPLIRWVKNAGELWSTNKKVIGANVDPPKLNFSTKFGP